MTAKQVLITGGAGYVGGWTIATALQQGFSVRATLRDKGASETVRRNIATLNVGTERLSFVEADLTKDESWDAAMQGVEYVLHVASPMIPRQGLDLIATTRDGTLRVLKAAKAAGVKRVVITSSLVAAKPAIVTGNPTDETVWTDTERTGIGEYVRAKTLSERAAWNFVANETSLELTTILPSFIQGPAFGSTTSPSQELIARMLAGKMPALPPIALSIVDVRDIVKLHLSAMNAPEAAGERIIGTAESVWLLEIATTLKEHFGHDADRVATRVMPKWLAYCIALFNPQMRQFILDLGRKHQFSATKAAQLLGWKARPAREAIVATAASILALAGRSRS
ncbi:NAD-dependent epimerase/dehydratase family protein [Ferrovibrio sp.]|uniref:NAD-dependent epimerase/dehydratase family protein n=1 Tax=Ferrovibrio sp. TaxID=1917215 RepID=UPI003D2D68E1